MDGKTYIASCSFGKDSIATILLALEHGEPLDFALSSEVMYDAARGISGELPEHIDWVRRVAIPKLEGMGCPVKMVSYSDYMTEFLHINVKGEKKGKMRGFPCGGKCIINSQCKIKPIVDFLKRTPNVVQYVGIATDEPERLKRLKEGKVSLLAKYGFTEAMAKELAESYGLLSPIYGSTHRSGCWFCPNRKIPDLCEFRRCHSDLWEDFKRLDEIPDKASMNFKYGESLSAVERKMDAFDYMQQQPSLFDFWEETY